MGDGKDGGRGGHFIRDKSACGARMLALAIRSDPEPPGRRLTALYEHLEEVHGFEKVVIRTDYAFESPEEAESLCRFFFGDSLADRVRDERLTSLPECTGLWWRTR